MSHLTLRNILANGRQSHITRLLLAIARERTSEDDYLACPISSGNYPPGMTCHRLAQITAAIFPEWECGNFAGLAQLDGLLGK